MAAKLLRPPLLRRAATALTVLTLLFMPIVGAESAAAQEGEVGKNLVVISGTGSSWSEVAIKQWTKNVKQFGLSVNYEGTGSSNGRKQFELGTVDYAVSEIPYGLTDLGEQDPPPARKYAYMPVVAGGTAFMYNLRIGGRPVTNLRLSGEVIAKIFTSAITHWNDPAILADNPGLGLPARQIIPVVRSDGSGTTAQLTKWLSTAHPAIWDAYCARNGNPTPCGQTSSYPVLPGTGMTALAQSSGVADQVAEERNEGTITYVEYAYALKANFPVAKVLNRSGYYVEPTEYSVAVALLEARINNDENSPAYLTQELSGVYNNADPRAYPLSSYSYMIIPTAIEYGFSRDKGLTLGKFAYYFLCEGQQTVPSIGYSPLPINLVQAGLEQVAKIKGADTKELNIADCNNPTFSPDGTNRLATVAPQPKACDKQGPSQCTDGTGGAEASTEVSAGGGESGQDADSDVPASGSAQTGTAADPGSTKTTSAGQGPAKVGTATQAAEKASGQAGATGTTGTTGTGGANTAKSAVAEIDGDTGLPKSQAVDATGAGAPVAGSSGSGGTAGATNGRAISATPISMTSSTTGGFRLSLMVLAGILLIAFVTLPPLIARKLSDRSAS